MRIAVVTHQHVEVVVGNQQLFFIVAAGQEPAYSGILVFIGGGELVQRAVLLVIIGKPAGTAFPYSSENFAPLVVPAVLGFFHILLVGAERHTERRAHRYQFGMLHRENHSSESSHRITDGRPVLPVRLRAVCLVNHRDEFLCEHGHIGECAVIAVAPVTCVSHGEYINHGFQPFCFKRLDFRFSLHVLPVPGAVVVAVAVEGIHNRIAFVGVFVVTFRQQYVVFDHHIEHLAVERKIGTIALERHGVYIREIVFPVSVAGTSGGEHQGHKKQTESSFHHRLPFPVR